MIEGNASEADAKAETMILNTEFSPLGWFLDLLEKDDGSVYGSAINSTESSVEIEDIVSRKMANAAHNVAPQILIVLFLIYLFDNIIQLISLRSLWYYGGW
jgi:hypothetical protein